MSYLVFARKYRPQRFDEVVGQEAIATTLKNAIQTGRVAHAYLFTGPRGVGKTSMARILSKALNCVHGPTTEPCNQCDICVHVSAGDDLDVLELDGATNRGIDEVRQIRDNVRYAASRARHKIYIIDEVHMLTKEAFNALLKTLEEPPPHVKFIFATTEVHRIPETILSRCQRFDFRRITNHDIINRLKQICQQEGVEATEDVLQGVARAARGAMRDSQSLLDKFISFGHTKLTIEHLKEIQGASGFEDVAGFVDLLAAKKAAEALLAVDRMLEQGSDLQEFLNQLVDHLRMLMLLHVGGEDSPLVEVTQDELGRLRQQMRHFSVDSLIYAIQLLSESRQQMRYSANARIPVELAVVKIAQMEDLRPVGEVLKRLAQLEQSIRQLPVPAPSAPAAPPQPQPAPRPDPGQRPARPAGTPPRAERAVPPEVPPPAPSAAGAAEPARPADSGSGTAGRAPAAAPPLPPPAVQPPAPEIDWATAWPQVIAQVAAEDGTLGNCLRVCVLAEAANGRVKLGFPKGETFSLQRLQPLEKRKVVEKHLQRLLGQPFRVIVTEIADGDGKPAGPPPAPAGTPVSQPGAAPAPVRDGAAERVVPAARAPQSRRDPADHPVVKKIQADFDARIVNIYETDTGSS